MRYVFVSFQMKEANYIIQVRIKQFYCGSAELFSDILQILLNKSKSFKVRLLFRRMQVTNPLLSLTNQDGVCILHNAVFSLFLFFIYCFFQHSSIPPKHEQLYMCMISRVIDTVVHKARLTRSRSGKFSGVAEGAWDTCQP